MLRADLLAGRGGRWRAHNRDRTGDLILTKDVLYRLSYVGVPFTGAKKGQNPLTQDDSRRNHRAQVFCPAMVGKAVYGKGSRRSVKGILGNDSWRGQRRRGVAASDFFCDRTDAPTEELFAAHEGFALIRRRLPRILRRTNFILRRLRPSLRRVERDPAQDEF